MFAFVTSPTIRRTLHGFPNMIGDQNPDCAASVCDSTVGLAMMNRIILPENSTHCCSEICLNHNVLASVQQLQLSFKATVKRLSDHGWQASKGQGYLLQLNQHATRAHNTATAPALPFNGWLCALISPLPDSSSLS